MNEEDTLQQELKLLELRAQARDQYRISLMKNIMRIDNLLGRGIALAEFEELQQKQRELRLKTDETQKNVVFISLRPPHNTDFAKFQKKIHAITQKKWLKRYIYVYEQKGETEESAGHGFHAHIILYRDGKAFSHIKREIDYTIKSIIDLKIYSAHDYKLCDDSDDNVQRLINYITGKKKDEHKHPSQIIDKYWRDKLGLADYYENNFLS